MDEKNKRKIRDLPDMKSSKRPAGSAGDASRIRDLKRNEEGKLGDEELEEDEEARLSRELELKSKEAASYRDQLLRLRAEFENTRKRQARERAQYLQYASEELIKSLLPVIKNLERANQHAQEHKDGESLREGVAMILNQFYEVLKKEGVEPVESLGQPFDPARHEVISCLETADHEENTVMEEFEKGYYLRDRLLCPSKVVVSKKPAREG